MRSKPWWLTSAVWQSNADVFDPLAHRIERCPGRGFCLSSANHRHARRKNDGISCAICVATPLPGNGNFQRTGTREDDGILSFVPCHGTLRKEPERRRPPAPGRSALSKSSCAGG